MALCPSGSPMKDLTGSLRCGRWSVRWSNASLDMQKLEKWIKVHEEDCWRSQIILVFDSFWGHLNANVSECVRKSSFLMRSNHEDSSHVWNRRRRPHLQPNSDVVGFSLWIFPLAAVEIACGSEVKSLPLKEGKFLTLSSELWAFWVQKSSGLLKPLQVPWI